MTIIVFLLIGLLAGWIGSSIIEGHGLGLLGDLIVGVIGAFVGGFVFDVFGVTAYGFAGSLVMAVIGAVLFLFLVSLFTGSRKINAPLGKI